MIYKLFTHAELHDKIFRIRKIKRIRKKFHWYKDGYAWKR